jgi:hypothetical protein
LEFIEADAPAAPNPDAFPREESLLILETPPALERYPAAAVDDTMPRKPSRAGTGMQNARDLPRSPRIPGQRGDLSIRSHLSPGDGPDAFPDPLFEFHPAPRSL